MATYILTFSCALFTIRIRTLFAACHSMKFQLVRIGKGACLSFPFFIAKNERGRQKREDGQGAAIVIFPIHIQRCLHSRTQYSNELFFLVQMWLQLMCVTCPAAMCLILASMVRSSFFFFFQLSILAHRTADGKIDFH